MTSLRGRLSCTCDVFDFESAAAFSHNLSSRRSHTIEQVWRAMLCHPVTCECCITPTLCDSSRGMRFSLERVEVYPNAHGPQENEQNKTTWATDPHMTLN